MHVQTLHYSSDYNVDRYWYIYCEHVGLWAGSDAFTKVFRGLLDHDLYVLSRGSNHSNGWAQNRKYFASQHISSMETLIKWTQVQGYVRGGGGYNVWWCLISISRYYNDELIYDVFCKIVNVWPNNTKCVAVVYRVPQRLHNTIFSGVSGPRGYTTHYLVVYRVPQRLHNTLFSGVSGPTEVTQHII